MIINTNIPSVNGNRVLKFGSRSVEKNMEKLSSGMRINRAGDDASGLAVVEKLKGQIQGSNRAEMNVQDGVSILQTAEGYLSTVSSLVLRLRELAIQTANGIYTQEDRDQIQVEVDQLISEVNAIAEQAQFNGLKLFTGRFRRPGTDEVSSTPLEALYLHIGANMDQRERIYFNSMSASTLGLQDPVSDEKLQFDTQDNANQAIGIMDKALEVINKERADLGSYENRLNFRMENLAIASANMQAAESRIRDVNMAAEMSDFTKNQILQQTSIAMLAQANALPQNILRLLQ